MVLPNKGQPFENIGVEPGADLDSLEWLSFFVSAHSLRRKVIIKNKSVVLGREVNTNVALAVISIVVVGLLIGTYLYGEYRDSRPKFTPAPTVLTFTPTPKAACLPTLRPLSYSHSTATTSFHFKQVDMATYTQTTSGNLSDAGTSKVLNRRIVTFTLTNKTDTNISIDRDTSPTFRRPTFVVDGVVWDELERSVNGSDNFNVDLSKPYSPVIDRYYASDLSREDIISLKPRASVDFMYLVPPGDHILLALGTNSFRAPCPSEAWEI